MLFFRLGLSFSLVTAALAFGSSALGADVIKTAKPLIQTESGLGFSIDRKPGEQVLSGSFVALGVSARLFPAISAGFMTLADGGKSAGLDNYRLSSLLTLSFAPGILADQLTLGLGPYTETLERGSPTPRRERGVMALFRLSKELYRQGGFALTASSLLGFYRPSAAPTGRTQGVSLSARFSL